MEIKQSLQDVQKECDNNDGLIEHWRKEHDQLQLEEIEYAPPVLGHHVF
jgi:hypothetical protein